MNKLEKIEHEARKAREQISELQSRLKDIELQRTEQENLQIIQQIRSLKLPRDVLYAFLSGGTLPASMLDGVSAALASKPETIYSRSAKRRQTAPDAAEPGPGGEQVEHVALALEGGQDEQDAESGGFTDEE